MALLHDLIPLALQASLFLLALAVGLDSGIDDALHVLRRPRLLLRALPALLALQAAALLLAVPLLALAATLALVLMAASPLPAMMPAREIRCGGHKARVHGLLAAAGALAVVTLPLAAALLGTVPGRYAEPLPLAAAGGVVMSVLVPLAAGMAIRVVAPAPATRAVPAIGGSAFLALFLAGLASFSSSLSLPPCAQLESHRYPVPDLIAPGLAKHCPC